MTTLLKWLRRTLGSCFFLGYLPGAPGTVGSAVVAALLWFGRAQLGPLFQPAHFVEYWVIALALVGLSIFLANDSQKVFGSGDPGPFIMDEVAGQFITFFMIPFSVRTLILGFLLFRFFDIVKPYPVHNLEELDEGLGITMDDVAAGVYANISLMAIVWAYHGIRTFLFS